MQDTLAKKEIARVRSPRIRAIGADATALGVSRAHLSAVLKGRRQSRTLRARYQELKASQKNKLMKTNAKLSSQGRSPMPPEFAALQNLQSSFFQTLTTLGLEVVLVRIDTSKNSPPGAIYEVQDDLENALRSIEAGQFDSDFYPLHSQCLFFHVDKAKLGAAMRGLKGALQAHGLLDVSGIYHAESAESLLEWYPGTAAVISIPEETE